MNRYAGWADTRSWDADVPLSPSTISRAIREMIPPEERNVSSITRFYRRLYGTVSLPRRGRIQMLLSSLIFALAAKVGGAKGYPVQSDGKPFFLRYSEQFTFLLGSSIKDVL